MKFLSSLVIAVLFLTIFGCAGEQQPSTSSQTIPQNHQSNAPSQTNEQVTSPAPQFTIEECTKSGNKYQAEYCRFQNETNEISVLCKKIDPSLNQTCCPMWQSTNHMKLCEKQGDECFAQFMNSLDECKKYLNIEQKAIEQIEPQLCAQIPQNHNYLINRDCITRAGAAFIGSSKCPTLDCKAEKIQEFCSMDIEKAQCYQNLAFAAHDIHICAQDIFEPGKSPSSLGDSYHARPTCFSIYLWNDANPEKACNEFKGEASVYQSCEDSINGMKTLCKDKINPVCASELCGKNLVTSQDIFYLKNCMSITYVSGLNEAIKK